jgi:hypothetical protein
MDNFSSVDSKKKFGDLFNDTKKCNNCSCYVSKSVVTCYNCEGKPLTHHFKFFNSHIKECVYCNQMVSYGALSCFICDSKPIAKEVADARKHRDGMRQIEEFNPNYPNKNTY